MRDEVKILECGCKIGRSKQGLWFYDFICEKHLSEVQGENGLFSAKKSEEFTNKLNEEIKKVPKVKKENKENLKNLSSTELEAYNVIKGKEKGIPINNLPHKLQGAVGKLKTKGLIVFFREMASFEKTNSFSGKKKIVNKRTNWVKIKEKEIKK